MIEERFIIRIGNNITDVLVKIINLDQYIEDVGGKLLSTV